MSTQDIVQKLWHLCHVLRDDGVTYQEYVTELTLLLFLKMAKETGREEKLPKEFRWDALKSKTGVEQLDFYRKMLIDLGNAKNALVRGIYAGSGTSIRKPTHLDRIVKDIDGLDWYSADKEDFGDLYEGLLEKNAGEKKSGAGQYFTPRVLIDSMVTLLKPQPGEIIQDPASGTGGFLIAADAYIKAETDDHFELSAAQQKFQQERAFVGIELVPDTRRLGLMNCMLHDIDGPPGTDGSIHVGDALSPLGASLDKADLILTNPPFGTKSGGGGATRDDFTFPTRNKQLAFLQHIYRGLKPGGRAGVVLPDNVLFEEGVGRSIREDLMNKCDLHTILRLPTGIFYAGGVKTNVLFFTRGESDKGNTTTTWVYDLRMNMPSFGKRTPFTRETLADFEKAYGNDPHGKAKRKDQGEAGRFRCFSRTDIEKRNFNLDISWLKDDDAESVEELGEPEDIANEIQVELRTALEELEELTALLGGDADENDKVAT